MAENVFKRIPNNPNHRWPSEAELRRIRNKLSRGPATQMLRPDADLLDRTKYAICREFVLYIVKKGHIQRELAKLLGVNESRVSEITRYHIHKLTLDRLVKYLEKLRPGAKIKIT